MKNFQEDRAVVVVAVEDKAVAVEDKVVVVEDMVVVAEDMVVVVVVVVEMGMMHQYN